MYYRALICKVFSDFLQLDYNLFHLLNSGYTSSFHFLLVPTALHFLLGIIAFRPMSNL